MRRRDRRARSASLLVLACAALAGCSSVGGYPTDPLSKDADLAALVANSGPDALAAYYGATDPARRVTLRNQIVYSRLAAYDIEFQRFEADILKESNVGNLTGDLTVLALNGVGATVGGVATKAALAAASAGVVGANAHISKELFYDRTIPAVLAQMAASRSTQLLVIQKGTKLDDTDYPLPSALMDTLLYREAGSLPSAINLLTANASASRTDAKTAQVDNKVGPLTAPATTPPGPLATLRLSGRGSAPSPAPATAPAIYRNLP